MSDPEFSHSPVMRNEVVEVFRSVPAGVVLDATLGGGGHSEAILDSRDDIRILGIDRDPAALAAATTRLDRFGERVMTYKCRFDALDDALSVHSITGLSGALFDLGVSSPQLDQAHRGFSYRNDGPLDMRMDTDAPWSANDVVNGYSEHELARTLRDLGDERFAKRIARAIVAARPIESTTRLAEVITSAIPAPARRTGGHPAKRSFQAIRIEVNGELEALPQAIDNAIGTLAPLGRIAVLAYHSGEDRIVKDRIREAVTGGCVCPPELQCVCGAVQTVRIVKMPKRPTEMERATNPRAASALFRVAERLAF